MKKTRLVIILFLAAILVASSIILLANQEDAEYYYYPEESYDLKYSAEHTEPCYPANETGYYVREKDEIDLLQAELIAYFGCFYEIPYGRFRWGERYLWFRVSPEDRQRNAEVRAEIMAYFGCYSKKPLEPFIWHGGAPIFGERRYEGSSSRIIFGYSAYR